ncbi:spore coat associated protein CotJA [Paenibacillus sp. P26]|nr:spore coat associated protein CotJA [Paenibacillus sp. P26]UUZ90601.1 spore coat associated protein CotJA [Paenibacillus sp. P25]
MNDQMKVYRPFAGKYDPCTPITEKTYVVPPHLSFTYQPSDLKQYSPKEALRKGTLWPDLYGAYEPKRE